MEQLQDQEVLMARNNETGQVGAVVGQNPDGTPQMADAKTAKLSDLVKFSKGQNPLEAFMSNFIRQAKNPSLFGFFRLPADRYDSVAPAMADMIQNPDQYADMLKSQKVDVEAMAKEHIEKQSGEEKTDVSPTVGAEEKSTAIGRAPIDANKIDWATIEKEWGVTREQLEKSGDLKQMVYNHKSPNLVKVTPTFDGQRFELDAKLSFRQNPDGSVTLTPHFIRNKPNLEAEYLGYKFSSEDKANLRKTGNLGKVVELQDPKTGEMKKCLVSLDRQTNEIESIPVETVFIKNKVANIELSMKDIGILKNGGIIRNQLIELADGRKFHADLQYNVEKRSVGFNTENYLKENREIGKKEGQEQTSEAQKPEGQRQSKGNWLDENGNPKRLTQWCKIPMDEQKQADYMAGKQVQVGMGKDKFGNDCMIYVQFDKQKGAPETTREYPDRAKVIGVADESLSRSAFEESRKNTQLAVNNYGKTNEATKSVREPLQKGQSEPKNETQQKEQKKPKGKKL